MTSSHIISSDISLGLFSEDSFSPPNGNMQRKEQTTAIKGMTNKMEKNGKVHFTIAKKTDLTKKEKRI